MVYILLIENQSNHTADAEGALAYCHANIILE